MPTMNDVNFDSLYTMFKGEPGTRKSSAALSYPLPQYWMSIDKKMGNLTIPMNNWKIPADKVEFDDYYTWMALEQKLKEFRMGCRYKTLILDSVTSCGDIINLQTQRDKSGQSRKDGSEQGRQIGGISVSTFDDYKAENSAFSEVIDMTKDIRKKWGVNIILIAHVVGERSAEQTDVISQARTIITGGKAISAKIPAYCEEIYHFNVKNNPDLSRPSDYEIITISTGRDYALTALPLDRRITFNDRSLYNDFILPAINKAMERKTKLTA